MPKIYVASSLYNIERARRIMHKFRTHGIEITHDWTQHGQLFSPDELRKYGELEATAVRNSNLLFLLQPGRYGSHVEMGIAIGNYLPIVILDDTGIMEDKTFYYIDNVKRFQSEKAAIDHSISLLYGEFA